MNRSHIMGFCITIFSLLFIGFILWNTFEIYPNNWPTPPSAEAASNDFLALYRWLNANNVSYDTIYSGNMDILHESMTKNVFIQGSRFDLSGSAVDYIINWISLGGHLFLSMDSNRENFYKPLLLELGITYTYEHNYDFIFYSENNFPLLDSTVNFLVIAPDNEALEIKDPQNNTRLVQLKYGLGSITVTGNTWFLTNWNLGEQANSNLAWYIFMHENIGEPWLFIRGDDTQGRESIFGSLFSQGNFPALLLSAIVLLIAGFWAVIPLFGTLKKEGTSDKNIRERFLAEGRFLKNHKALNYYSEKYIREIKRKLTLNSSNNLQEEQIKISIDKALRQKKFSDTILGLKQILESM